MMLARKNTTVPLVPVARLNAYLHALARFRGNGKITLDELQLALQDVTRRELTEDLQQWGIAWTAGAFAYPALARAIHAEVHRRRSRQHSIDLIPVPAPSAELLLDRAAEASAAESAQPPALIEAAYSLAAEMPEYFLASHGNVAAGRTAYRHQIEDAHKIVEQMLGTGIVVHEVGLGKTITALLVLTELLHRDPELTCLILVPSNLRTQWAGEIAKWSELKLARDDHHLDKDRYVLLAIDSAKEEWRAAALRSRQWGLLLVDEGHWLRNDLTERYRFCYSLRAQYRLLLTATPVHNSGYDIFHQVNMVRPGQLGRKAVFTEIFMRGERRITNAAELQAKLAPVLSQRQRHETDLHLPQRNIKEVAIPEDERSAEEADLYDAVLSLLRGVYRWHLGAAAMLRRSSGKEQAVSQLVLVSMIVLRELASHPLSALKTLAGPLRNRVAKLAKQTRATDDLRKLDEKLAQIVAKYDTVDWGAGKHRKTDHLIEQLPKLAKRFGRVIVYVEFRETQKALVARLSHLDKQLLRDAGLKRRPQVISYHGELTQGEKDHQIERLKKAKTAWFISTDAGGQGLNLQDAKIVVNFDFPWNPMRVEQRIGRIDRIGQKKNAVVTIENYITRGTIEEYVYRALRTKLRVCEDVLGRVIPRIFQLPQVERHYVNPDDLLGIGEIILSSEDEADLRRRFREFGEDIDADEARASTRWKPRRRERLDV